MTSSNCLRCLARPSTAAASIPRRLAPVTIAGIQQAAAFSSTPAAAAAAKANEPNMGMHIRAGKKMQLTKFKKPTLSRGKAPLPGERKALRKRVVLRNDNALPVPGLEKLSAENMLKTESVGKVMAIPTEVVDQLRAVDAFKPTQTWAIFRDPSTLMRAESVDLLLQVQSTAAQKKTLGLVITGDRITGKSTLLLQAMAYAYLNDWIVFHVPEAQELTAACTEYAPIPGSDPVQYMQPNYALKMMQALRKANQDVLGRLKTVMPHPELSQHVPLGSSLLQLASAAKEADAAWGVFTALWQEITRTGAGRPPIMFALDGLPHIMRVSDYRSASFNLIHSHDLALVRLFVGCLSGETPLPNGGAVLAATTRGNAPRIPSMDLALSQREAEQRKRRQEEERATEAALLALDPTRKPKRRDEVMIPVRDPYCRAYDPRVDAALAKVQVLPVHAVSRTEARALMEYWAASGAILSQVTEQSVSEKWTLGGNGIVGEMERAALLTARL